MAEKVEYLIAVVGADVTQFRKGMRDVRSELGLLDASSENTMARLGRTLTYTLTTPLAIGASVAVSAASEFDAAMRNINSVAFLTEERFSSLSQEVFNFGKNTREGATGAAIALNTIYQAGLEGEAALHVMKAATYAAEAGLANIETTAEGLVATMLAFGFTTDKEATRAADALTRMVQVGVGSMQAFAGSIATFLPSAAALGVSMEEAFGIDAMFTQFGYSASEAAVRVNAAMRSMIKPSEEMAAAITRLGVNSAKELIAKYGGLAEAIIALRGTTDGTEEALAKLFSDTRALQGVLLLTQNVERTRSVLSDFIEDIDGATDKARQQQMMSFAYSWDRLGSAIEAAKIKIGEVFLPILKPLVDNIRGVIIAFTEAETSTLALGIAVAGLAAALGPALWLSTSLLNPMFLLAAAAAWVAKEAYHIAEAYNQAFPSIEGALKPLLDLFTVFQQGFKVEPPTIKLKGWTSPTGEIGPELPVDFTPTISYKVKEGDTLWDIWMENFKEDFPSYEDFVKATGLDKPWLIYPDQIIQIGNPSETIRQATHEWVTSTATMSERFSNAFKAAVNYIKQNADAIAGALATVWRSIVGALRLGILNINAAIRSFFSGDWIEGDGGGLFDKIKGALDSFFSFEWLTNFIHNVDTQSLIADFSSLFDTIKNVALPEIAKTAGYISAQIARWFTKAIDGAFKWLAGGGLGTAIEAGGDYASDLGYSFVEGWNSAGIGEELSTLSSSISDSLKTMLDNTANLFKENSNDTQGYTPLYEGLRGAFNYLFGGGLTEDIKGMDGDLGQSILNLLSSAGEWLKTNAIPTMSRIAGYIVGTLGALIGQGAGLVFNELGNAISGGNQQQATLGLQTSIIEPFQKGMADAMTDMGVPTGNWIDNLLTGIAGAIGIYALANFGLFGPASAAIAGALRLSLMAVQWAFSMLGVAASFLSGLVSAIATQAGASGLFAPAAATISNALKSFIPALSVKIAGLTAGASAAAQWIAAFVSSFSSALLVAGGIGGLILTATAGGSVPVVNEEEFNARVDLPILVDPSKFGIDFVFPNMNDGDYPKEFGTGGMQGDLGQQLGEWIRSNIGTGVTITELPVHIPKIKITGTPENIEEARKLFPLTSLYQYMADHNIQIPFDDLFEVIPMEGFDPSDYIPTEVTPVVVPIVPKFQGPTSPITFDGININTAKGGTAEHLPIFNEVVPALNGSSANNPVSAWIDSLQSASEQSGANLGKNIASSIKTGAETHLLASAVSADTVTNALVTPVSTTLEAAYGPSGTVTNVWKGYEQTVEGSTKTMVTEADRIKNVLPNLFLKLHAALSVPLTLLILQFNSVRDAIREVLDEANKLQGVTVPTPAEAVVGKGSDTLPTTYAKSFVPDKPISGPTIVQPKDTSKTNNVNIIIRDNTFKSEADVRTLVKELRKRGYEL